MCKWLARYCRSRARTMCMHMYRLTKTHECTHRLQLSLRVAFFKTHEQVLSCTTKIRKSTYKSISSHKIDSSLFFKSHLQLQMVAFSECSCSPADASHRGVAPLSSRAFTCAPPSTSKVATAARLLKLACAAQQCRGPRRLLLALHVLGLAP